MVIQEKIASKKFYGQSNKEAYLKAIKWIYKHIYGRYDEIDSKLQFSVENVMDGDLPTCLLTIYCSVDESEEKENQCKVCKEMHQLFYLNSNYQCNTCNMLPYRKRVQRRLSIKKGYYQEKIFRIEQEHPDIETDTGEIENGE